MTTHQSATVPTVMAPSRVVTMPRRGNNVFKRIPSVAWHLAAILLLAFWATMRWSGVSMGVNVIGFVVMALLFVVLIFEVIKSQDISVNAFVIDIALAALALFATGMLVDRFWFVHKTFSVVDVGIVIFTFVDVVICSSICLRTAKRNINANMATPAEDIET